MSIFVVISFDITNGTGEDYQDVYSRLEQLGFSRDIIGDDEQSTSLPSTTLAAEFDQPTAAILRDKYCEEVINIFNELNLSGKIFVWAGDNWAWGTRFPQRRE